MFKHKCDSTFLFLSLLEKDQTCEKLCVSANENSSTAMICMVTLALTMLKHGNVLQTHLKSVKL